MLAAMGSKHGSSLFLFGFCFLFSISFLLLKLILARIRARVRISIGCIPELYHDNDSRLLLEMAMTVPNGNDGLRKGKLPRIPLPRVDFRPKHLLVHVIAHNCM